MKWAIGVASEVLGTHEVDAAPLKGAAGGASFEIVAGRDRFVLKAETSSAVAAEAWACRAAATVGAPAPRVIEVGEAEEAPFLLLTWIEGEPVDATAAEIERAGAVVRAVHEIEGCGWGWLYDGDQDGHSFAARHQSWVDALLAMARSETLESHGLLAPGTGRRVVAAIDERGDDLHRVATPKLLHGDLHLRHLLSCNGRLAGIIDWGDALFGDPLFEFGRFRRCGRTALARLSAGYGLELTPVDSDLIELYCCVWSLHVLNLEFDAGGDWVRPHVHAIERTLAIL